MKHSGIDCRTIILVPFLKVVKEPVQSEAWATMGRSFRLDFGEEYHRTDKDAIK